MRQLLCAIILAITIPADAQTVTTVAGTAGVMGNANGQGTAASFNNPHGVAIDPSGNLYIANRFGHTIRKITPSGVVSTFAGSGLPGATDGNGTNAFFNEPWAVACDSLGNVYVADTKNYKIRKITVSGDVTTLAGTGTFGVTNGATNIAQFGFPSGIAVNGDGSIIYVCDRMTNTIRKIENGLVTTVAGVVFSPGSTDGPAASARFDHPYSLALDRNGNLYIADEFNNKIRLLTPAGVVSTFAGDGTTGSSNGTSSNASFNAPWGVCVDPNGDVYVGDANNFTIRKISQGTVSLYAGQNGMAGMQNGPALQSTFNGVSALAFNPADNNIYLCDPYSQLVRKVAMQSITVATSTGVNSFCQGSLVTLVATPGGLSNYVFRAGTTFIGTSANGQLTVNSLSIGTHAITCTATNAQGQTVTSNTLMLSITQGLSVSINIQGSSSLCPGDTVSLTASLPGSYLWSNGATTSSITVASTGTYTVTVTNAQGCSGVSSPVQITTLQPPAATVSSSSNSSACPGDSVVLTAGAANSYSWSNGQTTQSISVTTPGNYTVVVTNGSGCSAVSMPTSVNFHPQNSSTISPGNNVIIPQGTTAILTANSGTGYLWSTGETSQAITVSAAATYTVTVTDTNGCSSLPATSQVSFLSASNMIISSGPTTFCEGDSVVLNSVFSNDNQWFRNGTFIPGATQQTYVAKQSGYYQVRYTPPSSSPVMSDSVVVTVHIVPNNVVSTPDSACRNMSAVLSVAPQAGVTYNWYATPAGGSSMATGLNFITPPLTQTTTYYVQLSNTYGCVRSNRFPVEAVLYPQTGSDIFYSDPSQVANGIEITFFTDLISGYTYYWNFGDPHTSNNTAIVHQPTHIYTQPGYYQVTLFVTNQFGCSDTIEKTVLVTLADHIFIPTGFTPNNDGNNDVFRVRGNNIVNYSMSIFNHWGEKIWFSQQETHGWTGESNGRIAPVGTYAYYIEVNYSNGTSSVHRGQVNLIR
jgi:gliding motility-associated-like protein